MRDVEPKMMPEKRTSPRVLPPVGAGFTGSAGERPSGGLEARYRPGPVVRRRFGNLCQVSRPAWRAVAMAWARSRTQSFTRIEDTLLRTVFSLISSLSAISGLCRC